MLTPYKHYVAWDKDGKGGRRWDLWTALKRPIKACEFDFGFAVLERLRLRTHPIGWTFRRNLHQSNLSPIYACVVICAFVSSKSSSRSSATVITWKGCLEIITSRRRKKKLGLSSTSMPKHFSTNFKLPTQLFSGLFEFMQRGFPHST